MLLWDLDPQGAATYLLRIKPKVKGGARKLVGGKSDVSALLKGTDHERLDLLPGRLLLSQHGSRARRRQAPDEGPRARA